MLVTINTDASHDPESKLGTYAFWIVSNDFRIKHGGVFKDKCTCSTAAEAKCILNALYTVMMQNPQTSKIIINTDSKRAIDLFKRGLRGKHIKYWRSLKHEYHRLKNQIGKKVKIEFRHVKAHNGVTDSRSFVNDWCDRTARGMLRTERNSKGSKTAIT